MTSYASQPSPDWPTPGSAASSPGDGPPHGNDQEPVPGRREWDTGPGEEWPTAALRRLQDDPPGPQPGQPGQGVPSGEQWAGRLRDQAPAREQWAGALRDQAPGAADPGARHIKRAVLSYLGIPFLWCLPALAVYLITPRSSSLARRHAAQALNLSITVLLYTICLLIIGGLLALDTVSAAVLITVPLLAALWIAMLAYLVRAAIAASHGENFQIPSWLCATLLR